MKMLEFYKALTEIELLQYILYMLSALVLMRICEWVVTAVKWLYGWIGSFFPNSIDKR